MHCLLLFYSSKFTDNSGASRQHGPFTQSYSCFTTSITTVEQHESVILNIVR